MSVLIKLNYKLPKELETNVKFKKCTVLNFQYSSKEKPNQSTKQQERKNKRARDTPLARIPRARPFFLLRPFTSKRLLRGLNNNPAHFKTEKLITELGSQNIVEFVNVAQTNNLPVTFPLTYHNILL